MTEVRHVDLVRLALFVIGVGLHVDEVDVGLNLLIFNIWNNDRTYCRTEGSFQFFKDLVKVGVLHIQLADKEHGCLGGVLGHLVGLLGADVDAGLAGYGDEQALHGARAFSGLAGKVEQSWSIDQVDLGAAPGKRSNRGGDGYLALDLLRIKVADGISFRDFSQSIAGACFKQQGLC